MAGRKEKKVRTTITLDGLDLAIVRQAQKDYGLTRSAAIRALIRQAGQVGQGRDECKPATA